MRKGLAVVSSITVLTSCSSYYPRRTDEQLAPASTITLTFAAPGGRGGARAPGGFCLE
jgi:hypothetical protein